MMNKIAQRKSLKGDERNFKLPEKVRSTSKETKTNLGHHSFEKVKKSSSKTNFRNEEIPIHRECKTQKKKIEDYQIKSNIKERSAGDPSKSSKLINYGDGYSMKEEGKIQKYVFHKNETVILKLLNYNLDLNDSLLTLYDSKKESNKKSYYILSAKEISYKQIKEHEAFQLKVKKPNNDIITDLILKAKSAKEKSQWLEEFGMKLQTVSGILKTCIQEVEIRRFRKGQKKRNELKELKDVDIGTLLRAIDAQRSHKLKFSDEKRWNISRMEKLIQILLSEIPQPLIPFELQKNLENSSVQNSFPKEYSKILKKLPTTNHTMLFKLVEHLENLTIYYSKELNASTSDTEKIRSNICSRLTPLIIRQELNKEEETVNSLVGNGNQDLIKKFCDMFYNMMEMTNIKKRR